MRNHLFFLMVIATFFLPSCKKGPGGAGENSQKEITQFLLQLPANSPYITRDIEGTIGESEIHLLVPVLTDAKSLVATFSFKGEAVLVGSKLQESAITVNDFSQPVIYTVRAKDGTERNYKVYVEFQHELRQGVPQLFINTENQASINSKDEYVKATLKIEGGGIYDDYSGSMSIKGRGNSTWTFPKKPYRLKLDKKAPILGLSEEKDWILLANYSDATLMLNAVAFKAARLFEMPFTNKAIPVDVTLNGKYAGSYMFTEHKEVELNRINVGDEGVLLELEANFDEPYKFHSQSYKLPVMVQYPELDKPGNADAEGSLAKIKTDFERMESLVAAPSFPANNYLDYFDATSFVRYMLVYDLMLNEEINYPKSTYMYKQKQGKYMMGPVWDFDNCVGHISTGTYFSGVNLPLLWDSTTRGSAFFQKLMKDPAIKILYKKEWTIFKSQKLPELLDFITEYASIIKETHARDFARWHRGTGDLNGYVQKLTQWLHDRSAYLDRYVANW